MASVITTRYWIPQYRDAGYSNLIYSLAPQSMAVDPFLTALNAAGSLPDMNQTMLLQYMSDVMVKDDLPGVEYQGGDTLPTPIYRFDAPTGLGQDALGVWFSTPDTGTYTVSWFVNGALIVEREQVVSSGRSITKAELGCSPGDVVQVAILFQDVAGWWARIEVT